MAKPKHVKSVTTQGYHFWDRGKPCDFNNLQMPDKRAKTVLFWPSCLKSAWLVASQGTLLAVLCRCGGF